MGVIYRCAIKLYPADRLAIGDGVRGDICLCGAAGLREAIDAGIRTRFGCDDWHRQRASTGRRELRFLWRTRQELTHDLFG
jgi:hypothetical protein